MEARNPVSDSFLSSTLGAASLPLLDPLGSAGDSRLETAAARRRRSGGATDDIPTTLPQVLGDQAGDWLSFASSVEVHGGDLAGAGTEFAVGRQERGTILPLRVKSSGDSGDGGIYVMSGSASGGDAFTLPLPPTTPDDIKTRGNDDREFYVIPGRVQIPADCIADAGVEGEHTDKPNGQVFGPSVPGTYEGDFVYFPPNANYPTGCVKIPNDADVQLVRQPDGRIIPKERHWHASGFYYWAPVDAYGSPGATPGWVNPTDHGQPGNGFPAHPSAPTGG